MRKQLSTKAGARSLFASYDEYKTLSKREVAAAFAALKSTGIPDIALRFDADSKKHVLKLLDEMT